MDKIKGILITILLFVSVVAMFVMTYHLYRQQKVECDRLQSNIEALRGDIERGFSKDNHATATIKQQTLTKSELKEIIHDELKSLDIKERDVKQVIITGEETKADVAIDTIVENDSCPTLPEYRYADKWVDLRVDGDSAHIKVRDSLLIANHAKTRRFLWWTWKRYSGKTTIKNYSPYSEITSVTSIDVEQ
ncbi:MAG: hypothetical protein MJZ30_09820 [Paludibacteraceae bacterium]|nr:hypothetical protein [Paludibacteraceae bacterium]